MREWGGRERGREGGKEGRIGREIGVREGGRDDVRLLTLLGYPTMKARNYLLLTHNEGTQVPTMKARKYKTKPSTLSLNTVSNSHLLNAS